jgi:2',3'-cyclic-nucleotide 2'-phosphodiesterase (5'-nucleotidase family)
MKIISARILALSLLGACAMNAFAAPDTEGYGPAQAAADIIREAAGADIAFLPAGVLNPKVEAADLSSILKFPADELAVVNLTGAQVRSALERSAAMFPSPSDAFLQVSNLEVTFSKAAQPDFRITRVLVAGAALDAARTYTVAMPATLARGSHGYFKIWKREAIKSIVESVTLESLLKNKPSVDSASRWRVTP